jgi:hypothetical protein
MRVELYRYSHEYARCGVHQTWRISEEVTEFIIVAELIHVLGKSVLSGLHASHTRAV